MALKPVTSPTQWRESNIRAIQFPSGNTARVRKLSMIRLAGGEQVPDLLTNIVAQSMDGGQRLALSGADLPGVGKVLDFICRKAFVEPEIAAEGVTGEHLLQPEDISDEDKTYLLGWLMGDDGSAAAGFPAGQNPGMGNVPKRDNNGAAPV